MHIVKCNGLLFTLPQAGNNATEDIPLFATVVLTKNLIRWVRMAPRLRATRKLHPRAPAHGQGRKTIVGENTLGPYRQCSEGRDPGSNEKLVGALPIRHVPVSRLRLRQVRVLWVFNCN
jgi:hypothetical protein